jgi:hypothetical protein
MSGGTSAEHALRAYEEEAETKAHSQPMRTQKYINTLHAKKGRVSR